MKSLKSVKWQGIFWIVLIGIYIISCTPVEFDKQSKNTCENASTPCEVIGNVDHYDFDLSNDNNKVDILFVDDNSGSMSYEQNQMANQFESFIQVLDLKKVNYRIGITTTDISDSSNFPRSINGDGRLQDGKLISFGESIGYFIEFLSSNLYSKSNLFSNHIQREETRSICEPYLKTLVAGSFVDPQAYKNYCPSDDERGIFAANLVIKNNPMSFIRPGSEIAVVILSDEDERGGGYSKSWSYKLEKEDLPTTLISNAKNFFPTNTLTVHSIIVRPGSLKTNIKAEEAVARLANTFVGNGTIINTNLPEHLFNEPSSQMVQCFNQQGSQIQGVRGSYGYIYALATRLTGGVEGDICASENNYATQLQNIGSNIIRKLQTVSLHCPNYQNLIVTHNFRELSYVINSDQLEFTQPLDVGETIHLSWDCPK